MKLIVLDRDGVINYDSAQFVKSPNEWKPIPGSLEAIAQLHQAGYRVVVATNQSGVGRGLLEMSTLNAIHEKMHRMLSQVGGRIDAIFYCPHSAEANCACRKPKPGLFEEISSRFNASLDGVPCVGDSQRDLECAVHVHGQPILVLTGKGEKTVQGNALPPNTKVFADLAEAVKFIVT
jgi:D-glycero-D-manno-heptose 1,7-bisphosphate phosphatase